MDIHYCFLIVHFSCFFFTATKQSGQKKKLMTGISKQAWLVGANFLPSTAINQLEMWQAESFDAATIKKELGWAEEIGMNVMRVYLHDLAWKEDAADLKKG